MQEAIATLEHEKRGNRDTIARLRDTSRALVEEKYEMQEMMRELALQVSHLQMIITFI